MSHTPTSYKPGEFARRCYELLCRVPAGRVTTYKALAEKLGTRAYRAVGQVMNKNPHAPQVPCHRVVSADSTLGGYAYGLERKTQLLEQEGIVIKDGKVLNFEAVFHQF